MLLQYSVLCQFCTTFPLHCSKLQHVQCCATCDIRISEPSNEKGNCGFEVLTLVLPKTEVFRDVSALLACLYQCFEGS